MNKQPTMKKVVFSIPDDLYREVSALVEQGWFPHRDEILKLALRKFLNSHRPEVMEKHILEDVEWGLRGTN